MFHYKTETRQPESIKGNEPNISELLNAIDEVLSHLEENTHRVSSTLSRSFGNQGASPSNSVEARPDTITDALWMIKNRIEVINKDLINTVDYADASLGGIKLK